MINELQLLSQSLLDNGITVPVQHPWIEGIRKGEALLVNMSEDGSVHSLDHCSPERVKTFWNIKESNKATFPKINVDPLWRCWGDKVLLKRIAEAGVDGEWDKWFEGADELLSSASEIFCKDSETKIRSWKKDKWSRLYKFPSELILPGLTDENEGVQDLIRCFESFREFDEASIDRLFIQIARMLVEELRSGRMDCFKLVQQLLIGKPDAELNKQPQTVLIFNHSKEGVVVANQDQAFALGAALLSSCSGRSDYMCPLTGLATEGATDKFPNPKLPIIGNAYLMAMNKDAPCHERYGKIGAGIFPVSSEACTRLDNVLRYITSESRKHKTWMSVVSGKWEGHPKKEVRDLLICYVENMPVLQDEMMLAAMMGGDSGDELRFESISSMVCDSLRKHTVPDGNSVIRVFVIRKISKGQTQIVMNEFCSIPELTGAADSWRRASENHPTYSLWLPSKKGEKTRKTEPGVPFPADLIRLLQYQWIREGSECCKLDSRSLVFAYDLFFDRQARTEDASNQTLRLILQRMSPLLIGAGRMPNSSDHSVFAKRSVLQAVVFLGIALFKLGHTKEKYMKSVGYNIGRLLSLADCLHRQYCEHVRNGDVPNNLLGNSLMQSVMDNPVSGLARLSERISVYTAPFERLHGEKYGLAHWAKKQMGIVTEQLSGNDLPTSADDAMKAQMLLGYLAYSDSKKQKQGEGNE